MNPEVDLYHGTYGHIEADVLARIRRKAFGDDLGQNSWTTAEEYRRWAPWLGLGEDAHVLEVASGSGGPAIFLAGLFGGRVTGIDINAQGVATALEAARARGVGDRVAFREVDAGGALPFPDHAFDAILCVDSANHFPDRLAVLKEWRRVLKPGGRALFTDPVVITGPVTGEELAERSSIGFFVFMPPGVNERLIEQAGLALGRREDVTDNEAVIAKRWHDARAEERDALVPIEGEGRYARLQQFFAIVHRLSRERRLSRIVYLARRPESP
ncbi:MAG: class I SAM-dependent methyltransferase [Candidatus Eiseniibacteriota bacterium]